MTRGATVDPRDVAGVIDPQMGRLDRQLAARVMRARVGLTIAADARGEAELLARRHGYELHLDVAEEPGSVWAEFWPITGRRAPPPRGPAGSALRDPSPMDTDPGSGWKCSATARQMATALSTPGAFVKVNEWSYWW